MELHPIEIHGEQPDLFRRIFFNESGLRAGWRLPIFIGLLVAIQYAAGKIISLAMPGLLGPHPDNLTSPFYPFFVRLVFFACMLLASWMMASIERRPMGEYGLPLKNTSVIALFINGYVLWGFLPLSMLLLMMRALHVFYFGNPALAPAQIIYWALAWGAVFLMVALVEEYMFRGYLLYTLGDGIGFWPAAIIMAVLFAYGHARNSGETRIGVIMTAMFAIFASIILWRTGSLWVAVGAHAGWDWGESFFYGVSDSGIQAPGHLLNPRVQGPDWLSGGSVGPEGSILALFLLMAMSVAAVLLLRKQPGHPALVITPASGISGE